MLKVFARIPLLMSLACGVVTGCGEIASETDQPRAKPATAEPEQVAEDMFVRAETTPDLMNPNCLSYGAWVTDLTSEGPDYPLPRFAPPVERRCVTIFRDNRQDLITILATDQRPSGSDEALVFGRVPNARGMLPQDDQTPGQTILITATTALGGQANADAMLARDWASPSIGKAYPDGLIASWRGISVEGGLDRSELKAAIDTLDGHWAPIHSKSTGNDRLEGMNVAARWDLLPQGRTFLAEVGAPDLGTVRDKPLTANYVHLEKKGEHVVAFVYHWESDFFSCYRGKLEPGGRLTQAQFVDAQPDPGVKRNVKGLGSLWPDHLVNRPMRPASKRVLREQADGKWGVPICRDYFAGKQDPDPVPF